MGRAFSPSGLQDQFRGALLGVAVGDALGAPFEGAPVVPPDALHAVLTGRGRLRYTDDTHMTLGMAESLLQRRGFDGAHLAQTFARNFRAEPWRGYGPGPPQVFALLEQGVPWQQAGRRLFGGAGSYGNGAAMRVVPAALVAFADLGRVKELARKTGLVTHGHELGLEGAVLQACALARLVAAGPGELAAAPFLASLRGDLQAPVYRDQLARVEALLATGGEERAAAELGNGVTAHESVPAALFAFLRHRHSFPDVVAGAIRLGGDTDTIASMAAALAGAHLGEGAIPGPWRDRVEGSGRLVEMADALLKLALEEGWVP